MTNTELAKGIKHGMFASRPTVEEAWEYVDSVARACGKGNHAAVITAVQVMLNTLSEQMLRNEHTEV
jgi:ribulose-5-phosphate 4-epimerase/fuculose-1-phosphate aldolase